MHSAVEKLAISYPLCINCSYSVFVCIQHFWMIVGLLGYHLQHS